MSVEMVERNIADFFPPGRRVLFKDCILQAPEATLERIIFHAPAG